ncbi:MAG: phage protease, partial [Pseudomonadota bacterium]
ENRNGEIWATVEWTEKATGMIAAREYRFISPVFYYQPDSLLITEIASVGLTNQPNLVLTALNRRTDEPTQQRDAQAMTPEQYKALCRRLGLKEDASVESVMAALDQQSTELQKAQNSASNPSLEQFAPRADYDAMKARAETAEAALADGEAKALNARAEAAVDDAIKAGKIAPGSKDYHLAACKRDGGLDDFTRFVADAPVNPALTPSGLNDADPAAGAGQLTEGEKAMCRATGVSEAAFIATRDGKPLPDAKT